MSEQNLTAVTNFLRNMSLLAEDLRTSLDEVSTPETRTALRQMVDNLAQAAAGIKNATDAINTIRGDLYKDGKAIMIQMQQTAAVMAQLVNEVRQLTRHVDDVVVDNRQEVRQLLVNLSNTALELRELSVSLRNDPSAIVWGTTVAAKEIPDP